MNDFILDENNDLIFKNNDIWIGNSFNQNVNNIIYWSPGDCKQFPTLGVGINSMILSSNLSQELKNKIMNQLKSDNIDCKSITTVNDELKLNF